MPRWIEETPDGVRVRIHVQPRAKRTELAGFHGDSVKVKLCAPPVDGRANEELVIFLAGLLGVPKGRVRLISGEKGREKRIQIVGLSEAQACEKLELGPRPT